MKITAKADKNLGSLIAKKENQGKFIRILINGFG